SVCEDLAHQLMLNGWSVLTTSTNPHRLPRLVDMLNTVWHKRHQYELAQIDVYSGLAFFWAEAVAWALRRAKKPYILTLHGGNLPKFSRRWPYRFKLLLQSATAITTPSRYLIEQINLSGSKFWYLPNPLKLSNYTFCERYSTQPKLIWLRAFHDIYN
ncbi:MAG: glycosyl transferase family 1, partial [Phototrophicales bacterium]